MIQVFTHLLFKIGLWYDICGDLSDIFSLLNFHPVLHPPLGPPPLVLQPFLGVPPPPLPTPLPVPPLILQLTLGIPVLKVARWQNLIPSFPLIAPGWRAEGAIQGREGIKFCRVV